MSIAQITKSKASHVCGKLVRLITVISKSPTKATDTEKLTAVLLEITSDAH